MRCSAVNAEQNRAAKKRRTKHTQDKLLEYAEDMMDEEDI